MGAFKEIAIEIEQLGQAVDELFAHVNPYDKTLITEIAEANGLDVERTIEHVNYMIGSAGQPYFAEHLLPDHLSKRA